MTFGLLLGRDFMAGTIEEAWFANGLLRLEYWTMLIIAPLSANSFGSA
jgi:hypothetical protein